MNQIQKVYQPAQQVHESYNNPRRPNTSNDLQGINAYISESSQRIAENFKKNIESALKQESDKQKKR